MLKSWLLALGVIAVSSWALLRPMQHTVVPHLLHGGTEQILAQWRDALNAYKADEGQFPPTDLKSSVGESRLAALTGENAAKKDYLDRNSVAIATNNFAAVDAWYLPLSFDPEKTGDFAHVVSSGPDRTFGTADDIDSRAVKNLHLTPPVIDK